MIAATQHSEGCPGGLVVQSYGRNREPRRRCSYCRRPQRDEGLRTSLQGVVRGTTSGPAANTQNMPRSLIRRALDRLTLS